MAVFVVCGGGVIQTLRMFAQDLTGMCVLSEPMDPRTNLLRVLLSIHFSTPQRHHFRWAHEPTGPMGPSTCSWGGYATQIPQLGGLRAA